MDFDLTTWKPKLSSELEFIKVDNRIVINHLSLHYQVRVNNEMLNILLKMTGTLTLSELLEQFNNTTHYKIDSVSEFYAFLKKEFIYKGIITSENKILKREDAKFLIGKVTLLPKKIINKIPGGILSSLFSPIIFFSIFSSLLLLLILRLLIYNTESNINFGFTPIIFATLYFSHFLHETGHAIAARAKHIKSGNIGFGFYYIIPVFFVDLSDAWNAPKKDRIIINLSGILIEYIICTISLTIFFIFNRPDFLLFATILFTKTFYNINPFIRSDIYWVLSDIFNRPNLNESASFELNTLFKRIFKIKEKTGNVSIGLALYGLGSLLFWLFIFFNLLVKGRSIFQEFPSLMMQIQNIFYGNHFNINEFLGILYKILLSVFICVMILYFAKTIFKKLVYS